MNHVDEQYLSLVKQIMDCGARRGDRTGTGTRSLFGAQLRFDLSAGFPLLTTKRLHFKSIVHELLWFIRGDTSVRPLQKAGVSIWDEWATAEQCARFGREEGELGPVYGHQWRNFGATVMPDGRYQNDGFDQLQWLVNEIRRNPNSRRLVVTGWNPREVDQVALPPCHSLFQVYVQDDRLSCHLYQRSADVFLGVPFNIASYALLTHMLAHVCLLKPGEFIHSFGDVHLYNNHAEQALEQLGREPRELPQVRLNDESRHLFTLQYEDVTLDGYNPHPRIAAPVAV